MNDLQVLGVVNGLFNCSQNLNECSLARTPKFFAVARMFAFLSVLLKILWILPWIKVNVILYGA